MIKRILAWVMLAGFIFLLLNLFLFGWYTEVCVIIYVIIFVVYALFGLSKGRSLDFTKSIRSASDNVDSENKEEEKELVENGKIVEGEGEGEKNSEN
ncbi:MAG: hypothetical protein PHV32_11510 [Eubacteriales bacterium]|nr:hypothetical protein [Eubacteriales bacterium]